MSELFETTDILGNEIITDETAPKDADTSAISDEEGTGTATDEGSTQPLSIPEPRLFANKYKSTEELERAHLEAQKKISEQGAKLKEYVVPEEYVIESTVELVDDTKGKLTELAKQSGLTQSQFNKIVEQLVERNKARALEIQKAQDEVKQVMGDEKLIKLDAYIDLNYPAKLANSLKYAYRQDKEMALDLYQRREQVLNTTFAAGVGSGVVPMDKSQKLRELALKLEANPNDVRARQEFEQLSRSAIAKQ